jgi:hypothetical protein
MMTLKQIKAQIKVLAHKEYDEQERDGGLNRFFDGYLAALIDTRTIRNSQIDPLNDFIMDIIDAGGEGDPDDRSDSDGDSDEL